MLTVCNYEQLDPRTKAYLREVRETNGRGAPGVYFPSGSSKPLIALILGVGIMAFTLMLAGITGVNAFGFASLVTAGFMLGGWLILYAFRRWIAPMDRFGRFFYFDPAHVFVGEGETIRYAALPTDTQIAPFGTSSVAFDSEQGSFVIALPSREQAALVVDYYSQLDWVLSNEEGKWAGLTLSQAGAVARFLMENEQEPPSVEATGLSMPDIPEEVSHPGQAASGALMLLLIPVCAAGLFLFVYSTNGAARDNLRFARAKELADSGEKPGKAAAALRDYLKRDDNRKHRDEAAELLSKVYDKPISTLQANTKADPVLRDGVVALLQTLRTPPDPVATLSVMIEPSEAGTLTELRKRFADGISTACGGMGIISFVAPSPADPDNPASGDNPAMITISCRVITGLEGKIDWTVTIRTLDDTKDPTLPYASRLKVVAVKSGSKPYNGVHHQEILNPFIVDIVDEDPEWKPVTTSARDEMIFNTVMLQLVGQSPPKAIPGMWD